MLIARNLLLIVSMVAGFQVAQANTPQKPVAPSAGIQMTLVSNGGQWTGTYDTHYVAKDANGLFDINGKNEWAGKPPAEDMDIDFFHDDKKLTYIFDRDVLNVGETDDKTCNKDASGNPSALPRKVVFLTDLEAIPAAARTPQVEGLIAGIVGAQAKLGLKQKPLGLILGKKCANGKIGDDLRVPIMELEVSDTTLNMKACLGPFQSGQAMGFSIYKMEKILPKPKN